jgi:putative SOS response-associated peptidase YedK
MKWQSGFYCAVWEGRMCGRFVSARKRLELLEEFAAERDRVSEDRDPDYNVAPTKRIYAVLENPREPEHARYDRGSGVQPGGAQGVWGREPPYREEGRPPGRELRLVRWGLVPPWAKDTSGGARMINARAETVAVKPAFRSAFKRRRCIIPADGYYEWQAAGKAKQPYYIYRTDGGILAFAGIYEVWRDESLPAEDSRAWYWSAAIITTDATDDIGRIHDRTPMVIAPESWADWLDPANNDKEPLLATMLPATSSGAGGLTSHPVSMAVNSVRNNGPALVEPLGDAGSLAGGSGSGGRERPPLF